MAASKEVVCRHMVSEQWLRSRFDIGKGLGAGFFSTVNMAKNRHPVSKNERLAIKTIDKQVFLDFEYKQKSRLTFKSEGDMLSSLDHSNILKSREWL